MLQCYTRLTVCSYICLLLFLDGLGVGGGAVGHVIKIGTVALIILTHFYVK